MERITSRKNPLVVHMKKLGSSRAYRDEHREFICDGIKLLNEAVRNGARITTVLTASETPLNLPYDVRVFLAERELIDYVSPLKNAQDVLFACEMPPNCVFDNADGTHILLDGIQDPGNLGTIIRTANAFGITSVMLMDGCADVYNPKTIRASMGAVFRQRVCHIDMQELREIAAGGAEIIGAALSGDSVDISDVRLTNAIIAIGSEGQGLSDEVLSLCGKKIVIPISPECESLNAAVAAGIIMWQAGKG